MKQFSLEEYIKDPSKKVVTRDGRKVRIVCTDVKSDYSIIALIEKDGIERGFSYLQDGKVNKGCTYRDDLFFDERRDGWVNLYRAALGTIIFGKVYETKDEALGETVKFLEHCKNCKHIDTIKIQWEE